MASSSGQSRVNPTLFDKLVADTDISGLRSDGGAAAEDSRDTMRYYSVPKLERFNEAALRATVRRDIAWLLNTTHLGAVIDLDPYPHVQTSVLNYGVPDLAGKSMQRRVILQRARDIRNALRAYEPRINPQTLTVEPVQGVERENSYTFMIQGDVTSAVQAIPIKFKTDIEADTSAAVVRE